MLGIEPGRHRSSSANRLYAARTLYSLSSYTGAQKASLFIHSFNHMCFLGIAVGGVRGGGGVHLPGKEIIHTRESNLIQSKREMLCCAWVTFISLSILPIIHWILPFIYYGVAAERSRQLS